MIKNENYFQVSGWMVNELHLKGSELCVYAIIYGFTQDGDNWFEGTRQYLAEFTGISRTAVDGVLSRLQEKGLIEKKEIFRNGVKFNNYKVAPLQETCTPPSKKLVHPLQETWHHNIEINKRDNILPLYSPKGDAAGAAVFAEAKRRINRLFNRRETTAWTEKETRQLKAIAKRAGVLDEIAEIEALYNSGYKYRRRDIITFLNNFSGELDRARNTQQQPAAAAWNGAPRTIDDDMYWKTRATNPGEENAGKELTGGF